MYAPHTPRNPTPRLNAKYFAGCGCCLRFSARFLPEIAVRFIVSYARKSTPVPKSRRRGRASPSPTARVNIWKRGSLSITSISRRFAVRISLRSGAAAKRSNGNGKEKDKKARKLLQGYFFDGGDLGVEKAVCEGLEF